MKYLNVIIIAILLFSCTKEDGIQDLPKTLTIQFDELAFSGCKDNKSASTNNETIIIEPISENKIKVTHQNVMFNCCIDEPIVKFEVNGNSIQVNENSTAPVCNCICPYDIEFTIDNLEKGKYSFTLIYETLQKVKLSFKIPLKEAVQCEL